MSGRLRELVSWILLLVAVSAVELVIRFVLPFRLGRVLAVEALLFLAAGVVGMVLAARSTQVGWRSVLQWILGVGLTLAGIRAALWALGLTVSGANLVIALGGLVILAGWWVRRRMLRRAGVASGSAAA